MICFVLWLEEEENECVSESNGERRAVERVERKEGPFFLLSREKKGKTKRLFRVASDELFQMKRSEEEAYVHGL